MKIFLSAVSICFFSACEAVTPQPARITFGAPKYKTKPPSGVIPRYVSIELPVQLTNTSMRPIWFYGILPQWPFTEIFSRVSDSARWTDGTMSMCGLGASFYQIPPGGSITFPEFLSSDDIGHQIRVEVPIYKSDSFQTELPPIRSEPFPLR